MNRIILVFLTVAGASLLAIAFALGRIDETRQAAAASIILPIGHESAPTSGLLSNGWAVPDDPAPFATAYRNLATFTGPAIGANNGVTQDFYFAQLLYVPTSDRQHQIELQDLGRAHALLRGLQLTPDVEPDPMVERLILDAAQTGYDPRQLFGRIITGVLYDPDTQTYEQYTDKQLIVWRKGDLTAHRQPLGCLMNQQCNRMLYPIPHQDSAVTRMLPLLGGGLMLLLALGILLHARLREAGFLGEPPFHGV
jgi:hypothetical protein